MRVPILLPNIFNHPFTYDTNIKLKLGDYVEVPFGKSKATGVVWDEFEKKNNKDFKLKTVLKKLNVTPLKKTTIKTFTVIKTTRNAHRYPVYLLMLSKRLAIFFIL